MPFKAECPFCSILVKDIPDDKAGESYACPRCLHLFALPADPVFEDAKSTKGPLKLPPRRGPVTEPPESKKPATPPAPVESKKSKTDDTRVKTRADAEKKTEAEQPAKVEAPPPRKTTAPPVPGEIKKSKTDEVEAIQIRKMTATPVPGETKKSTADEIRAEKRADAGKKTEDESTKAEDEAPVQERPARKPERVTVTKEVAKKEPVPWFLFAGLLAIILGGAALTACSFSGLELAALGVAGLGLILGAMGFLVALQKQAPGLYPLIGAVVSLVALGWAGLSYLQKPVPEKPRTAAELAKTSVVPLGVSNPALSDARPVAAEKGETIDVTRGAVQQGDLRMSVTSVAVASAPLEGSTKKKPPPDRCIVVGLRLSNVGVERRYPYTSWGEWGSPHAAKLVDKRGRNYPVKSFDASLWQIKGQVRNAVSIFPGKSVNDVLVFEGPPPKTTLGSLTLELPASAFGGEGTLLLEIPARMILQGP